MDFQTKQLERDQARASEITRLFGDANVAGLIKYLDTECRKAFGEGANAERRKHGRLDNPR